MPVDDNRKVFELCDAENMMDDAETVVLSVKALGNPQQAVAEMLAHIANVGYLLALQDMQLGIETAEKRLHGGKAAITGMRMAAAKIEYVYGQVYEFMHEKSGVDEWRAPDIPLD